MIAIRDTLALRRAATVLDNATASPEQVRNALYALVDAIPTNPVEVYILIDPLSTDSVFVFERREDRDAFEKARSSPEAFTDDSYPMDRETAATMIEIETYGDEAGSWARDD